MKVSAAALCVALVGCGHHDEAVDAMPDSGGFATAPHTPLPRAVAHTGVVLDHVKLVTITYSDYPNTATVEAFGDAIVTSPWYAMVGADYGVGAGTHDAKYHLGTSPTTLTQDTDLETQIDTLVTTGVVPRPTAGGNEYLYMLYVPATVPLGASLHGEYGYHGMLTYNGIHYPYAIVLDDGTLDDTTSTAAHELIEAATDPTFVDPNGDGWWVDAASPDPWYLDDYDEVADMCDGEVPVREGTYAVPRIWSNTGAAADNPCVPVPAAPDDVWMDVSAEPATMPRVPKGQMVTFTLTGWSTQPIADWSIEAPMETGYSDLTRAQMAPRFSTTIINNKQTVTLTLTSPSGATNGQLGGLYVTSGPQARPWVVGFIVQ